MQLLQIGVTINSYCAKSRVLKLFFLHDLPLLGVCQANDIHGSHGSITEWNKHNNTMEMQGKKPPNAHGFPPNAVKGKITA